jgi:hypothetical protein
VNHGSRYWNHYYSQFSIGGLTHWILELMDSLAALGDSEPQIGNDVGEAALDHAGFFDHGFQAAADRTIHPLCPSDLQVQTVRRSALVEWAGGLLFGLALGFLIDTRDVDSQ